jgi:hypothetical protein
VLLQDELFFRLYSDLPKELIFQRELLISIAFDAGKARFEMNLSGAKGLNIPADAAAQMQAMGLDQITTISLPENKFVYLIYPGLQSYVENPLPDALTGTNQNFKVATTELGKETVDGHPCVENKVVVSDDKGATNEFTVWNATDLKNFPVKIITTKEETEITMSFTDVSLAKPVAASFNPPAGYTRYDTMQNMVHRAGYSPLPAPRPTC